jgi:hypothetical protein
MKLYLHIGTEKTGTTTIQRVLFQNKTLLGQHGFHFLQCAGSENNRALPAYCMADGRFDDFFTSKGIKTLDEKNTFKNDLKSKLDYELSTLPENVHSVIISSEHFHSRVNSNQEVQNAFDLFSRYFSEISIICYLREQSSTCVALYSTAIKTGLHLTFDEMLATCVSTNNYYNYYEMLSNWRNVFGFNNLNIRAFNKENFINSDLIDDFFNQINPNILDYIVKNIENKNESLTRVGQFIGRAVNKSFPKVNNSGDINPLRNTVMQVISQNFQGKGTEISKIEYEKIYNDFSYSNELLNKEYFGKEGNFFSRTGIVDNSIDVLSSECDFEKLANVFSTISNQKTKFPDKYADLFRDVALEIEISKPKEAYELMKLAYSIRPKGSFIRQKLEEYEKKFS